MRSSVVTLDNATIRNNDLQGVHISRAASAVSINNGSLIEGNGQDGIYVAGGALNLDGSTVQNNVGNGLSFWYDTEELSSRVANTTLSGNTGSGVYFDNHAVGVTLDTVQLNSNSQWGIRSLSGVHTPPTMLNVTYSANGYGDFGS